MKALASRGIWVLFAFVVAILAWPAVRAYTMSEGESALASVEECHAKFSRLDPEACTGTWRSPDGSVYEGRIQGADPEEDVGRQIRVRLGPLSEVQLGPLGGAWSENAGIPAIVGAAVLSVVIFVPVVIFYYARLVLLARSLRKRGARNGGTVLLATRHEFHTSDGRFHARVHMPRRGVPPPPFATVALAQRDQSRFGEVQTPDGQVRSHAQSPLPGK